MKRSLAALIIKEMQIKTTMGYIYTYIYTHMYIYQVAGNRNSREFSVAIK